MKKKILCIFLLFAILLTSGTTVTLAWLLNTGMETNLEITGKMHKSYFESGDGTAAQQYAGSTLEDDTGCAFEIHNELQLYYLAWLQELGYFNIPDDSGNIAPTYFYLSADLDMANNDFIPNCVLPAIGTSHFPFIGNFDGNGHVIKNLKITTDDDSNYISETPLEEEEHIQGVDIVGLFGVVGSTTDTSANPTKNVAGSSTSGTYSTTYTYDSTVNEIKNFGLYNVTIETKEENTLIGIVAGYVNGVVQNVAVADSGINITKTSVGALTGITENISDYSIVGYCTPAYIGTLDVEFVDASEIIERKYEFTASDSGDAWGGSIDMKKMHTRIYTATDSTVLPYPTSQTVVIDEKTGEKTVTETGTATDKDTYRYRALGTGGSYYYYPLSSGQYLFIGGRGTNLRTNTVTTITKKKNADGSDYLYYDAYYYQSNGNYLNLNNAGTGLTGGTGANTAWALTPEGYLYTLTNDNLPAYLNFDDTTLSVGQAGESTWQYVDSKLQCKENGLFLYYTNGAWTVSPETYYVIGDGQGNYLQFTSNTAISNTKTLASATRFEKEDNKLFTYLNGSKLYLQFYNNNTLRLNASSTNWTSNANGIYTGNYYIYQNGGNWMCRTIPTNTYTIAYNGTYMRNNGTTGLAATNDATIATRWTFSNTTGDTKISVQVNGNNNTYYIRRNTTPFSTTNSNNTWTWNKQGDGTVKFTNSSRYIRYADNKWGANSTTDNNNTLTLTSASVLKGSLLAQNQTVTVSRTTTTALQAFTRTVEIKPTGPLSYFPLSANGDKDGTYSMNGTSLNVTNTNTGYVIGGSYSYANSQYADIRVSYYAITNIRNSYSNGKITNIRTITNNNSGTKTTTTINLTNLDDLSTPATDTYGHTYVKFKDSLAQLTTTLSKDTSNVYGLHFMDAAISTDHIITAPAVSVNGNVYENYQLPESCIDFTLKEKGYINFFAGTYYSSREQSFFSLHQIIRDGTTHEITAIKAITKVYKHKTNPDLPFVYLYAGTTPEYSDGKTAAEIASDYVLAFDLAWIGDQGGNIDQRWIYYFEIPANPGEYALGSVPGANGAYLLYLDISASMQRVEREESVEKFETFTGTINYPKGVQFVGVDADGKPLPYTLDGSGNGIGDQYSAAFTVLSAGDYSFSRKDNTITPTVPSGKTLTLNYSGIGISVPTGGSTGVTNGVVISTPTKTVWRIIQYDENDSSEKTTRLVTTVTKTGSNTILDVSTDVYVPADTGDSYVLIGNFSYQYTEGTKLLQNYIYAPGTKTYSAVFKSEEVTTVTMTLNSDVTGYTMKINDSTASEITIAAETLTGKDNVRELIEIEPNTKNKMRVLHYIRPADDVVDVTFDLPTVVDEAVTYSGTVPAIQPRHVTSATYANVTVSVSAATEGGTVIPITVVPDEKSKTMSAKDIEETAVSVSVTVTQVVGADANVTVSGSTGS